MNLKILSLVICLFIGGIISAQTFQDGPARETDGDFPANWDLIKGSAQVGTFEGNKVILFDTGGIITPKIGSTDYLSDTFTIEFEAYFDDITYEFHNDMYKVRFWNGIKYARFENRNGSGLYHPMKVYRHGAQIKGSDNVGAINHTVYKDELKETDGIWRVIQIEFDRGALKVFIDRVQILNIPNYKLKPTMISIEGHTLTTSTPRILSIKNINLTGITDSGSNSDPGDENGETTQGETTASGLEALDEGNGIGWRLIGRDPSKYGNIGENAVDLSNSHTASTTRGATAAYSTAFGFNTTASNSGATAMGHSTLASGVSSTAMGEGSEATGNISFAVGISSRSAGKHSVAIGFDALAFSENSFALGLGVKANNKNAFAIGNNSEATGENSFSIGFETKATEAYATAIGYKTTASLNMATAFGNQTIASGFAATAMGETTVASGSTSMATGFASKASGDFSTAMGFSSDAIGNYSTAIGHSTKAIGDYSTAFGNGSTASKNNAIAIGNLATASGESSFASGFETEASGVSSFAGGSNTMASGVSSFAAGSNTIASRESSFAAGSNTKASGEYSTAFGQESEANGSNSTALGFSTKAGGSFSTAIGYRTDASGEVAISIGSDTKALGDGSMAIGLSTMAEGSISLATGHNTKAVGVHSATFGENTEANTTNSIAMGSGTVANCLNSLVIGQFNETVFTNNEVLFQVGNGTSNTNRRDAFWIAKNGNALLRGNLRLSGYLTEDSDKRLKKEISELSYGLKEILQLNPKSYFWKNKQEEQKSLGLIAQDVQPLIKELVHVGEDANKTLGLNYTGLIPVLIKAMQEQQEIIDTQNKKIEEITSNLSEKDDELKAINRRLEQIESHSNINKL